MSEAVKVVDQSVLAQLQMATEVKTLLGLIDKQLRGKPFTVCIPALGTALCALCVEQGLKTEDVQKAVAEFMGKLGGKEAGAIIIPARSN